ncbi:hypothetical protein C0T31_04540 [Dysgonamonadaceae bacterium]|nr:hypothetical protein C0T31_04540 [Dysgonamonadaceae bacterium]
MNRRQKPAWKAVLLFATKAQRREVLRLSEFISKSINHQINQLCIVHYPFSIDSWGVAPNPTCFFALMQKSMQKNQDCISSSTR